MRSSSDLGLDINIMLNQGDFDLRSVQMYTESLKKSLKKTMLSQEVIFRKQVEELHQLYSKQKALMENLVWRELDRYKLRKASAHSNLFPSANSAGYEPLVKETMFSSIPMAGPMLSTGHKLEGCQGMPYNLWQGPRDIQLHCDQHFSNVDPELKLSLRSGYDNWGEGSAKKTWFDKKARIIIDLEESIERVSNEGEKDASPFSYAAPTTHSGGKHQLEFSVYSDLVICSGVKKDLQDGTADSRALLDDLKCRQEQVYLYKESKDCSSSVPSGNLSTKMQQLTFRKAADLDLNKVQLDESSCCTNDLMVAHPSTANSAQVFIELVGRVQEDKRCSNDSSDLPHQDDDAVNSSLIESNSRSNMKEIWARSFKVDGVGGSEVGLLGAEAISKSPPGLCEEDLGGHSSDLKDGNNGFTLELTNDLLHDPNFASIATGQINFEQSEVNAMLSGSGQSQNSVQDGRGTEYHASCKSHSNIDNDSGSVKTMQSRIEMGSSNLSPLDQFPETHVGCQVAETSSGNQNQEFADSSGSKHEFMLELGGHSSDLKDGNNGFMLELTNDLLHDPNCASIATGQINFEQSEVNAMLSGSGQSQNSVQDGRGTEYHASCKSHSNIDNDSSSVKTMQSRIEMGSSNLSPLDQFPGTHVGCQVAEISSGNQNQEFADSSGSKHEFLDHIEESPEADELIHRAAESLVHFSLEITSGNHDCSAKAGLAEMENVEREQPLCSSDSFELIALNLKECSADEYSVSSKPFEVNDMETKDSAFKLRRGRRLKDFQKDILPGLSCLSRHEIREDINILEGVLRSREYRKIRAKMANGHSWCAPVRNRRSRINYARRKRF